MIDRKEKLPIGIENFGEIRGEGFYYVDKTGLIKELLESWGKVNLFTRPRRFGKSLNMSMLKEFFDLEGKKELFDGLAIAEERDLCEAYMGKFPVMSISLKGISGDTYESARLMAVKMLTEEAAIVQFLLESSRLTAYDKEEYAKLLDGDMNDAVLYSGLRDLSRLLEKHYGRKVILLIDEYDVPLAKAFDHGHYDLMVTLIHNLFEQVLKTNDSLQFAVMTGCMRISKESIFTGLNNLKVLSIADVRFDEYFGFTDAEVQEMLSYYGIEEAFDTVKEWYNGYQFGGVQVYCPWDVINYCDSLRADPCAQPQNYWANTSGNDAVRRFVQDADTGTTKREIEKLVAGEVIEKEIRQELTYKDMYDSIDNLWSVLFITGYLTQRGILAGNRFRLAIPNLEIRNLFTVQIMEWFKKNIQKDGEALSSFCQALQKGDVQEVEGRFTDYLRRTISIRDTFVKKTMKENFYHGMLLGILGFKESWSISSNKESGDGYSDILIEIDEEATGIVIEVKYAEDGKLESGCQEALRQIEDKRYEEVLREAGMEKILKYGIACHNKRCMVLKAQQ